MSDMKKMGVLGPLGTHSEAAAQYLSRLLPERPELLVYPDIFAVIQAVEDGEVDSCLVPVENSLEGAINITLDTLARSDDLFVVSELIWPVHNQLMARPGTQKICCIYSHPQPISQCRGYLQQHYPEAELIKVASTARAAEIVAKEPRGMGAAAICTKRGGELNGLVTVATEIQDNMANATRFFELRRVTAAPQAPIGPAEKMLVICEIDGQKAGALYDVLKEFADRGVNMTRIESRPARTELGAYIFFFDLDVADNEEALRTSVEAVARKSKWLKDLGSFPVVRANP
ncbi:prephenate dehydratase [Mitsuokella jalaludinii]|uniref:prephenate dehydratase n=1 Tax=Mitsuokella jalaludinii TaxID=187979 RepID=UPI002A9161B0|nr:prephenate dehydratase [Mitsuokella jalaludinii]MDY5365013.1 prephenate dehydratase [Mitsuokella jalaludinii]